MIAKRKSKASTPKRDPSALKAEAMTGEGPANAAARISLRPTIKAAVTIKEYSKSYGELDLMGLVNELSSQVKAVEGSDMGRAAAMLTTQAHTLDAIFNNFAARAIHAEYMDNLSAYLKLALRAQAQCQATWDTLATIKNPPMMGYVKQANIAHGSQQVNNSGTPTGEASCLRESENLQNELLEAKVGERLDIGAAGKASKADPEMETVGEVNRA
jgi:hypothetical protein